MNNQLSQKKHYKCNQFNRNKLEMTKQILQSSKYYIREKAKNNTQHRFQKYNNSRNST